MQSVNLWPLAGIIIGATIAGIAGMLSSAFAAVNLHQLKMRVQARERGARKLKRLLRSRRQLDFMLQATLVGGIASGTAAALQLQPLLSVRGAVLLIAVLLLLLTAVQLGIRSGRRYAERVAALATHVLLPVQKIANPALALILPAAPASVGGQRSTGKDELSAVDTIRNVLLERSDIGASQARMLRAVLDLEQMRVGEIMVPRAEIVGIDLDSATDSIDEVLRNARYTRLPLYRSDINNVVGILHARDAHSYIADDAATQAELTAHAAEPYFVPEGTRLDLLLRNMQREHRRLALVVDEYGDVQGLVTVDDVLEQIVGEYTTDFADTTHNIAADEHGGYIVDASLLLRDINRELSWNLPLRGPRTLNGLILEHLEFIPNANLSLQIDRYRIEILAVRDNAVRRARVTETPEPVGTEDL